MTRLEKEALFRKWVITTGIIVFVAFSGFGLYLSGNLDFSSTLNFFL